MNEMLGNQYFMARNYLGAADVFQNVLLEEPKNLNATKKLIISLTQIGKYSKAFDLFTNFINENIDFILNTDPIKDDCPCAELVTNLETKNKFGNESITSLETLGILWLYCDINNSIQYFEKALVLNTNDPKLNSVITILRKKIKEISNSN